MQEVKSMLYIKITFWNYCCLFVVSANFSFISPWTTIIWCTSKSLHVIFSMSYYFSSNFSISITFFLSIFFMIFIYFCWTPSLLFNNFFLCCCYRFFISLQASSSTKMFLSSSLQKIKHGYNWRSAKDIRVYVHRTSLTTP